jgi:hypothetical protein
MKALKILALAGLMLTAAVMPSRALVINDDEGGVIVDFIKLYSDIRDTGEKIVVDGECDSSCTLFLGLVPKQNYCVTPNAKLGFHTASVRHSWPDGSIAYTHASEFSALMWNMYPGNIRAILKKVGWNGDDPTIAHPQIVYLNARQLTRLGVRACGRGDAS